MQAHELSHGSVVMFEGGVVEAFLSSEGELCIRERIGNNNLIYRCTESIVENLSPLPLSPAVLAGLGLDNGNTNLWWAEGEIFVSPKEDRYRLHETCWVQYAHQLQALAWFMYGVTLTWNQAAYEAALTETKS